MAIDLGLTTGPATSDRSGAPSATIRVYLLDDHELVRRGLCDLLSLEAGIEVVGHTGSAVVATRRIPALRPDVAVLDARLGDGSGIEVGRDVRSVDPSIKVLILTSYDDEEAMLAAFLAGASGYVLKNIRGRALVDGIRRVAANQSLFEPAVVHRVLEHIRMGPRPIEELSGLTDQERRILELITEGLTNRQIGDQMCLAEKTVKNYVSHVLAKLGMQRRTQAAVFASRLPASREADG